MKKRTKSIATVVFNDEITKESIMSIIVDIEKKFDEGFDVVNLYFSSTGGSGSFAQLLIDYLNDNEDRIVLKLYDTLFSAGMWIAKYSKCPKEFLPEITLMIHTSSINNGDFKDLNKKHASSTWGISEINKLSNERLLDEIRQHLLPDEQVLYKKDEDVYIIDQRRIKSILK